MSIRKTSTITGATKPAGLRHGGATLRHKTWHYREPSVPAREGTRVGAVPGDTATYYRRVANELRATAELAETPSFKATLLTLATQFERLADYSEHWQRCQSAD
jgi:hypothetical protein